MLVDESEEDELEEETGIRNGEINSKKVKNEVKLPGVGDLLGDTSRTPGYLDTKGHYSVRAAFQSRKSDLITLLR